MTGPRDDRLPERAAERAERAAERAPTEGREERGLREDREYREPREHRGGRTGRDRWAFGDVAGAMGTGPGATSAAGPGAEAGGEGEGGGGSGGGSGGGAGHPSASGPGAPPNQQDATPATAERNRSIPASTEMARADVIVPPPLPTIDVVRLVHNEHTSPHAVLGAHPAVVERLAGVVVRAFHPDATSAECLLADGERHAMLPEGGGLFAVFLPGETLPLRYRLRFGFPSGERWERGDPYCFLPTLGDVDLHLFNEGTHRRLWEKLGAQPRTVDGVAGTAFAVWAPNARRVSLIGDFCGWDGRQFPMRLLGASGVYELFVPDVGPGALYKFEILGPDGRVRQKADPYARGMELAPATAARVEAAGGYAWDDDAWMETRGRRDHAREPMLVYEVHLGSWAQVPERGNSPLSYGEIAPKLAEHVRSLGFTHVELMPVAEHPFGGSWGYQVTGYYAPTARYGTPDDFRHFVDVLHQHGVGVIVDWVPAHFPKDDFALRRFDGTALYEHEDPRLGDHPDWGTHIFNYGRTEVRNFLTANALFWLDEFHVDGLRVDAVASMLYLDYSRQPGQWLRNRYGGRENLEAIDFLRETNELVRTTHPGCFTVAEESTAWPGVTRPAKDGGLGFNFKWNMGWMHDTLAFFAHDPVYRRHHQDQLTFAMVYEYHERFVMPISHDEVVHLKRSLVEKMPGDEWQRLANLRLLLAYQYTRPGKKLLFMGTEIAQRGEWNHDASLDWHLADEPLRRGLLEYMAALGRVYHAHSALWRRDHDPEGFAWIDTMDRENSVLSYLRRDGEAHVVVVLNFTPVPREHYRVGVPAAGAYVQLISTDDAPFGGSGYPTVERAEVEPVPFHGFQQSVRLMLPPLGAVVLAPEGAEESEVPGADA